jgi:RNA polymerase sigma-70 factor (ECF subfamily)
MSRFVDIVHAVAPGCETPDDLEARLAERVARAVTVWPDVSVGEDQFVRAIAKRIVADAPIRSLDAMQTDDLYLAIGCALGDRSALDGFEAHHGPMIARAIASTGAPGAERDDLGQIVRQRLLVKRAKGNVPRIASYSARGPLRAWLRVVVGREVARTMARARREIITRDGELADLIGSDDDPEIGYLNRLYREEFGRAFRAAATALDAGSRLLLEQYAFDGRSIDQLAALHRVHRATAARKVKAARQALLVATRREMVRRLQLSPGELAGVMCQILSQLDIGLLHIAGEVKPP